MMNAANGKTETAGFAYYFCRKNNFILGDSSQKENFLR